MSNELENTEVVVARRYNLLDRLGVGGMGEVWRAHDMITGQTVAIKILRPPVSAAPAAEMRFQREILAMARLNHPRIVPIIDAGSDRDVGLFFIMELQEGKPLHEVSNQWKDWTEMSTVVDQILDTLAHAHSHAVIHRDIKPDNVLVNKQGEAVLLDFGVARLKDRARSGTSAYDLLGTVDYAAPEQATGNRRRIGPWTDLYCFGIVLYEIICGRVPFWASSPVQSLIMRLDTGCPPLDPRPGFLTPVGLWEVLNKLMQPCPFDRFRTAAEARAAFAQLSDAPLEQLTPAVDGVPDGLDLISARPLTDDEAGSLIQQRLSLITTSFEGSLGNRPPDPPLRTTTLVGRDELLLQLSRGLGRWIKDPKAGVLVLAGQPGSGKTRLVRELLSPFIAQGDFESHHHRWRMGPSMRATALSIMGATALANDACREHVEWWLTGLRIPEPNKTRLLAWSLSTEPTRNPEEDRIRFASLIRHCAQERPFVLTLDGVHTIDEQALGITSSIRDEQLPVIIVVTCKEIRTPSGHIPRWLKTATRVLDPLEDTELGRIVDELLEVNSELRELLVEKAKGNPKQLFNLIYRMRREARLVPAAPRWLESPDNWDPPTDRNVVFQPLQSVDIPLFDDDDVY